MIEAMFPFSAIVGQEQCKLALILNMIDPHLGGVLLVGKSGTGKTILMRSAVELVEALERIDVPLGITEEQLLGEPDYARMINHGQLGMSTGLLKRADGKVIAVDDINLMSEHLLFHIGEASEARQYQELNGFFQKTDFILFGNMNPDEGWVVSRTLERFGMLAETLYIDSLEARIEIIKRQVEYERDPISFRKRFQLIQNRFKENLARAKDAFKQVEVSDYCYAYASRLANENNFEGHRGEVTLIRAAKALSAWENRYAITDEDITRVSQFIIPIHGKESSTAETTDSEKHEDTNREKKNEEDKSRQDSEETQSELSETHKEKDSEDIRQNNFENNESIKGNETRDESIPDYSNLLDKSNDSFENLQLELSFPKRIKKDMGTGKRAYVRTRLKQGRYIKSKAFKTDSDELALDATIRRAVLFQRFREKGDLAIAIEKSDLRAKIREKKTGASILFVIDSSGSMTAKRRLQALKASVLSLLKEAYEKRDRVGIISFKGECAEMILPITHSHYLAHKRLRELSIGGRTPLALALEQARYVVQAERSKNPQALQMVVIISDGRSNVPLYTTDALADAMSAAKELANEPTQILVLDCEDSRFKLGLAKQLSETLKAEYVKLNEITANEIVTHINQRR